MDELEKKYNPHTLWVFHQLNKFKGGNNMPNLINTSGKSMQVLADAFKGQLGSSSDKTLLGEAVEFAFCSMQKIDRIEGVLREWYNDTSEVPDGNYYMNMIRGICSEQSND
jgi:hypothetical protein